MYLLDTGIIIYFLKNDPVVVDNFRLNEDAPKALSVITYGELLYGAENSARRNENLARIHRIAELFPVINVSKAVMETLSSLKFSLKKSGRTVGDFNLIIASTAITIGYSVVTNNQRHFDKIPGLNTVNWKTEILKF